MAEEEKRRIEEEKRRKDIDREIQIAKKRLAMMEDHWGKFVESLVSGGLIKLLNKINIPVNDVMCRREKIWQGKQYEFDLIAQNGMEEVVGEVKTTLRYKDIEHFEKKLKMYKKIFGKEDKIVYGAIAFINVNENSDKAAMKKGFIVIKATGDSASILNKEGFKPKAF